MTPTEHDKSKIRFVFDLFTQIQKLTYQTEIGQEIGKGVNEAISDTIKPYMIELSKRLNEE